MLVSPFCQSLAHKLCSDGVKGGHLDFSHLTEFKTLYITEIYMAKLYISSIIKNHEITEKRFGC